MNNPDNRLHRNKDWVNKLSVYRQYDAYIYAQFKVHIDIVSIEPAAGGKAQVRFYIDDKYDDIKVWQSKEKFDRQNTFLKIMQEFCDFIGRNNNEKCF